MAADPALQDQDAQLFAAFNVELYRTVRKVVNTSAANVEDACADAWLSLLRFQPERRPTIRGWLVVVAIREAIKRDQRDRRSRALVERGDREDPMREVVAEHIDALQSSDDAAHDAKQALDLVATLSERDRRVFILHVAGYSYDEIAELTGVTRTAVDRYLRRARSHVRGCSSTPKRGRPSASPLGAKRHSRQGR